MELSAFLRELRSTLIERAMTVSKIDQSEVETSMVLLYKIMGRAKPEFLWVNNPWQLHFAAIRLGAGTVYHLSEDNRVSLGLRGARSGRLLSVMNLENSIGRTARLKLEDLDIYAWHGVRMPPEAILTTPSVGAIENERDIEVRRVLIDRYGAQNYILDSGSVIVHYDECGTLYLKEVPPDENIVMVRVTNSTAEPDGEFKTYFLRVPPTMKTAREAVAWTFGLSENEYFPLQQT